MENIEGGGSEDTLRTSQLQTLINKHLELKCISGTEVELKLTFVTMFIFNAHTEHL